MGLVGLALLAVIVFVVVGAVVAGVLNAIDGGRRMGPWERPHVGQKPEITSEAYFDALKRWASGR